MPSGRTRAARSPRPGSTVPWWLSGSETWRISTRASGRRTACSGRAPASWCSNLPRRHSPSYASCFCSISGASSPRSAARCRNIGTPIPTCQSRCSTFRTRTPSRAGSRAPGSRMSATRSSPAGSAPCIMALDNLQDFLVALDARGELTHVAHPVSVDKQITEVADRCMKSAGGGPALVFDHRTLPSAAPARYPVAVNLFGSEKRMALALGVECLDEIGERIATLLNMKVPDSLLGKLAMLPQLAEVAKFPPKTIGGKAQCPETVIREKDEGLAQFPAPGRCP